MKFSEKWLREWVDPAVTSAELCEQLTMAGLEVEACEPVAPAFSGVVVGEVKTLAPHPQADRLQICQVDIGAAEALSIVCGAQNVRLGMKVPTACIGARLPAGMRIKKTRLRGVESQGMLCSARELGLAEAAEGLMALPPEALPGTDVRQLLDLDDHAIELGLTPNRSDCLSVAGIAREVAVLNRCGLAAPAAASPTPTASSSEVFAVEILQPAACPRYVGCVVRGIDPRAVTPLWMQERLRRSGLRSISAVVDISNYVMLELGQPMHAFDLDRLSGGIQVRLARPGEKITLLDEQQLSLTEDTLVIADHHQAVAMAGIMGGLESAVDETTENLFLESAFFTPASIAGRARQYGLHTDSSHRFERGVDYELPARAMDRALSLLLEIVGGEAGPVMETLSQAHLPAHQAISLRAERVERLLGLRVASDEIADILVRLGFRLNEQSADSWEVEVPSFRFDISMEADLIEEIARIYGFHRLPETRPMVGMKIAARDPARRNRQRLRHVLVDRGYQEVITYSFVDARLQQLLDPGITPIALANPISPDTAVMRTTLWAGLLQALAYNMNRQQRRVRLFECGSQFIPQEGGHSEPQVVAGVASGPVCPEQWGSDERPVDFFDVKGDLEVLLATLGQDSGAVSFISEDPHPALHPGQAACLRSSAGDCLGWLGALHPRVCRALQLEQKVLVFELNFNMIAGPGTAQFRELSKFPAIRRDLAIVVDEAVTAGDLQACIRETAGEGLQQLQLFDVFRGKGIDSGKKSLALGLTLQAFSRTLTDSEIDALIERVLRQLQQRFGATLRE